MKENKIIGLVSCYEVYNYGSQLMSLALQLMIEKIGLPCEHIQYIPKHDMHYYLSIPMKLINKPLRTHKKELKEKRLITNSDLSQQKAMQLRKKSFDKFIDTNMMLSVPVVGYTELKKIASTYRCVLLGSDQVWHPMNLEGDFKNMEFVPDNVDKIVYGASFGVTNIPRYQKKRTIHYLNRIKYISVREEQGATLINEIVGRKVSVVLDPTLMVDIEEWREKLKLQKSQYDNYIFVYFLGNNIEYRKKVKELKKKTGKKVIAIDSYNMKNLDYIDVNLTEAGPDEFVNLIRNADYVCTDSFHGTVFSILNQKKFVTFLRYATDSKGSANSRVESLLKQLCLINRIYKGGDLPIQIDEDIDYVAVTNTLNVLRKKSSEYLMDAFRGCGIL